jgi:hypothetical protein
MAKVRKRTWNNKAGEQTAWIADYFDQEGKRHIKTFDTKKAASAWLVTTQGEVVRGVHTPENASITVAEAAELWIQTGELDKLERSTLRQYRNHADLHIVPLIGTMKLARLSTPAIEAFRDELLKKGSRAMARKVLASLKSILGERAAARARRSERGAAGPGRDEEAGEAQARGRAGLPVKGRDQPHYRPRRGALAAASHRRNLYRHAILRVPRSHLGCRRL